MLGTDLDAVGGNEFRILDSDEAEHPAQIGFEMLADSSRRARTIKAAARDRDDDALVAGQALDALRAVLERLARDQDTVDPGLELLGIVKLYMGAPSTMTSAARNSCSAL